MVDTNQYTSQEHFLTQEDVLEFSAMGLVK